MTTATQTEIITVAIDIPLGDLPRGYEAQLAARGRINFGRTHLQVQLKQDEAQMMLRLRQGLRESNAKLEDSRPVVSNADALRWILAQISDCERVKTLTEEEAIAAHLNTHGEDVTNKSVIEGLKKRGIIVQSAQVTAVRKQNSTTR